MVGRWKVENHIVKVRRDGQVGEETQLVLRNGMTN